jgi:gp16 family phage-associated protein
MATHRKGKTPARNRTRGAIKTPEQVLAEFDRTGTSVSGWATAHGHKPSLVFEVLAGRVKGKRGKGHVIAVQLGLKAGEVRA